MKKLLSISICFFTISSYALDTTIVQKAINQAQSTIAGTVNSVTQAVQEVTEIPDSAQLTFSKVYQDVKTGISALASSLKVGADHVYGVLVKQQMVYAFTYIATIILLIIVSLIGYKEAKSIYKSHRETGEQVVGKDRMADWDLDDSPRGILSVAVSILTIGCAIASIIVFCVQIDTIMMGIINPEYGAIKDIISIVK